MTEYRFYDHAYYTTAEFHADRAAAEHLAEDGHRLRLFISKGLIEATEAKQWIDFGAGNGGLLEITDIPDKRGVDFQPANVADARRRGRPVEHFDFIAADALPYAQVASLTEVLEHLDDPHSLLRRLDCDWLVASVPNNETPDRHWFGHTWGWDVAGFVTLIADAGFEVAAHVQMHNTQHVLARRPQ
jgi:hypothetical protein